MLRLNSLVIENFRGIQMGAIQDLAAVNILVGKNNSGKTTVLEAISRLMLRAFKLDHDILSRNIAGLWLAVRGEKEEYPANYWFRQATNVQVSMIARVGAKGHSHKTDATVRLDVTRTAPNSLTTKPNNSFMENGPSEQDTRAFCAAIALFRPVDGTNRAIETQHWPQLLSNRRDKVLTRTINEVFGLDAESVALLPDERLMVLFREFTLPLDAQGDGARTALRALMVLALLRDTMFLIEEPECHQHPASLERYAKAICKMAQEQRVQIMLTTHSAECVRSFLLGAKQADLESAVFHLSLDQGKQVSRRLDAETVETLQSTGADVRYLDLYA